MIYKASDYYRSVQLAENFYCYVWQGRGNNCNTCLFAHVLRGERPHVIIDPGHIANEFREPCFDSLAKAIEADGLKIEDTGMIINTHSHADHCRANEAMIEKSQAWVAMSREEDEYRNTLGRKAYSLSGTRLPEFAPLFYLREGDLSLGVKNRVELQVFLTPGHTPGSICLYWPAEKMLISGDVVFYGSIGRADLPGGSLSSLKKSIDRLSQLELECLVPGHSTEMGSILKGKRNIERNFQSVKLFF